MQVYKWKRKDKWLYTLSMLPFVAMFFGTAIILSIHSLYLIIIWAGLYILTNFFQAGCCVGCPYRGKYCPAFCGVYLGNILSGVLYKDRQHDDLFFKRNATAGEITLLLWFVFPLYWIFKTGWYLVPIYLLLILFHIALFLPTQCSRCSYNSVCPGGQAWLMCQKK